MPSTKLRLTGCRLYYDTNEWSIVGSKPKGGSMSVILGALDLDDLRCAQRQIGKKIGELVEAKLASLKETRDEAARAWRFIDSALKQQAPGGV